MQKALHLVKDIYITQEQYGSYSHTGRPAIDYGQSKVENKNIYAPFDCKLVSHYNPSDNALNTWYLESLEPVEFANGTVDYATILLQEGVDTISLSVGQTLEQGTAFYTMGSHVHIEVAPGKFTKQWAKIEGTSKYQLPNGMNQYEMLFIEENTIIRDESVIFYNWIVANEETPYSDKTNEELAYMVWAGELGVGDERKALLGSRYDAVMELVNQGVGKEQNIAEEVVENTDDDVVEEVTTEIKQLKFVAEKDGKYFIYLKKGDVLYKEII